MSEQAYPVPGSAAAAGNDREIRGARRSVSQRQAREINRSAAGPVGLDGRVPGRERFRLRVGQRYYGNISLLNDPNAEIRYSNMTLRRAIGELTEPAADYAPSLRDALPQGSWLIIKSAPYPAFSRRVSPQSWMLIIGASP